MPIGDTKEPDETKRRSSSPSESYIFHPATRSSISQPTRDKPHCKVFLLDGQYYTIPVDKKAKGKVVINELFRHLELRDLQEKEYFSVYYVDLCGSRIFLNPHKQIRKQVPNTLSRTTWELFFGVQFYATKLTMLADEMTRYLYVLQICRDIKEKRINADRLMKLQLLSLLVQANCGDYDPKEHKPGYIEPYIDMIYNPSEIPVGLSSSVIEVHKEKTGFKPSEADNAFFMIAKSLYKYGQQIFPVHDRLGQSGQIGASLVGLFFHKDGKEFMNILWKDVVTIGHRKKKLRIRYHPKGSNDDVEHMLYLYCSEPNAKVVWRGCVEQHTFFRLEKPTPLVKNTIKSYHSFKRNSELRFSRGRTMHQMLNSKHKQPEFRRSLPTVYLVSNIDEVLKSDGDPKMGPAVKSLMVATPPPINKSEPHENKVYMTVEITKSEPDLTRVVEFTTTEKQKYGFTVTFKERTPSPPPIINSNPTAQYLLENSIQDETVTAIAVDVEICTSSPEPTYDETKADPEQNKDTCDDHETDVDDEIRVDHQTDHESLVDYDADHETDVDDEIPVDHHTDHEAQVDHDADHETDVDDEIPVDHHTDHEAQVDRDADHETDVDDKIHADHQNTKHDAHVDYKTGPEAHVDHDADQETHVDHETDSEAHESPEVILLPAVNQESKIIEEDEEIASVIEVFPIILQKKNKLEYCSRTILFYLHFLIFYFFLFLFTTSFSLLYG